MQRERAKAIIRSALARCARLLGPVAPARAIWTRSTERMKASDPEGLCGLRALRRGEDSTRGSRASESGSYTSDSVILTER